MKRSDQLLRMSIKANAIFSSLCGLILIIIPGSIAELMDIGDTLVLRIIGVGLLGFVMILVNTVRKNPISEKEVKSIIVQDWIWVIGSVLLVILNPFAFSLSGIFLIIVIAIFVMTFALLQAKGLKDL